MLRMRNRHRQPDVRQRNAPSRLVIVLRSKPRQLFSVEPRRSPRHCIRRVDVAFRRHTLA
jgi:hypothetical protein